MNQEQVCGLHMVSYPTNAMHAHLVHSRAVQSRAEQDTKAGTQTHKRQEEKETRLTPKLKYT